MTSGYVNVLAIVTCGSARGKTDPGPDELLGIKIGDDFSMHERF